MQIWPWWKNEPHAAEVDRLLDVGVVEDDQRGVAAELEVGALEVARRPPRRPRGRPAVEPVNEMTRTCGSATMRLRRRRPRPAAAGARRRAGRPPRRHAAMLTPPVTTVRGSGLSSTALPSASAGATERMLEDQRHVERRDDPDHADRDALGHREPRLLAGQELAERGAREARRGVALLGRDVQGEPGHARDGADLADVPAGELLGVLAEQVAGAAQHGGPLRVRQRRPLLLGLRPRRPRRP